MVGAIVEVFYPLRRLSMMTPLPSLPDHRSLCTKCSPIWFLEWVLFEIGAEEGLLFEIGARGGCCSRSVLGGCYARLAKVEGNGAV
jgi:hypothetical protein